MAMPTLEPNILVIDDDENYPRIMKEAVRAAKLPATITWLESGEKGLAHLEEKAKERGSNGLPSLIFLDINMPGMNGFEVLRRLRENKALPSLPVIMLSVSQSPDDINQAYRLGANAYLSKPTDFQELQDTLQAIQQFWFKRVRLPLSK
jgi:CheY-like chemotaxis protein